MNKVMLVLRDVGTALLVGVVSGVVIALVLFLAGFIYGGASLVNGLEVAKDGMFLIVALGLFLLAGLILVKGKKADEGDLDNNGWRRHFRVIGPKMVVGLICVGVLMVAVGIDYIMWVI